MAIWRCVAFWISKATRTQAHASVRALAPTQTHHTHALARAHSYTHTHTEVCNTYCFYTATVFPERASVLLYTYTASLVANKKQLCVLCVLFSDVTLLITVHFTLFWWTGLALCSTITVFPLSISTTCRCQQCFYDKCVSGAKTKST